MNFKDGPPVRIKEIIKYDHYKKYEFKTKSTITYGTVGGAETPPANPPASAPNPPNPPKQ